MRKKSSPEGGRNSRTSTDHLIILICPLIGKGAIILLLKKKEWHQITG
jgi:hypothetical protein